MATSSPTKADEPPKPPVPATEMVHKGEKGTWFHEISVRRIFLELEERKTLQAQVATQAQLIATLKELDSTNTSLIDLNDEIANKRLEQLTWEHDARVQAEKARDAWYRSPTLWFAAGLVIGAGVIVVAQ